MKLLLLALMTLLTAQNTLAETIRIANKGSEIYSYRKELLKAALEYANSSYSLMEVDSGKSDTQKREIRDLLNGNIDVICLETSATLEANLTPIHIPIYKSVLNRYLLLIRAKSQPMFDHIASADDLKKFTLGQLVSRSNTQLLKAHNFKTAEAVSQESLVRMLERGRVDAVPLSIYEIQGVLKKYPDSGLAIESRIAIVFDTPCYFFVSPAKQKLASDIERGLQEMEKNGDFDQFFYNSDIFRSSLGIPNLSNRNLLALSAI